MEGVKTTLEGENKVTIIPLENQDKLKERKSRNATTLWITASTEVGAFGQLCVSNSLCSRQNVFEHPGQRNGRKSALYEPFCHCNNNKFLKKKKCTQHTRK
jgi:hypothetical protein